MHAFLERVALRGAHMAEPGAVIVHGEYRVTVLTARLLRLEWAPAANFDDRPSYAFPSRHGPRPPFHMAVGGGELLVDTGQLRLTLSGMSGPFGPDNLYAELSLRGATLTWRPGDSDWPNLRGARRTLDGCRGEAALETGLLARSGWALHDDSATVRFNPSSGWVEPAMAGPRQDWYLFGYGHDFPAALAEYAQFGGRPPMIPRWALGPWWSRYWAYSDQELRQLVTDFAAQGFPLAVLVIDMDWHTPHGWTGYSWNRELLPDPPALLAWLHARGLRVTLNLHPAEGVQPHEDAHAAVVAALGVDAQAAVPFCISDPAFAHAYFELLHHPLEAEGVDFWWMDWQRGRTCELPGLDPLPWLNHLHFHDLRRRQGCRPLIFSRWGGLGNHRYPIGFSGDTYATWEALRFQPYFTATAANVLYGWWSHDIGGHFGACAPELFARWVQLGALSPILRLHATKDEQAERRPWAWPPEVRAATQAAFLAREQLKPYLYTLARVLHEQALSPCRPLYYSWPEHEAAYVAREQYLLGDQLLAAPIVYPAEPRSGLAPAYVWVPPGDWIERAGGELLHGPAWVRLCGDLQAMPQLMRAGAILPLAEPAPRQAGQRRAYLTRRSLAKILPAKAVAPSSEPAQRAWHSSRRLQPPGVRGAQSIRQRYLTVRRRPRLRFRGENSALTLEIFPGPSGALRIYDDAGEGEGYREGQYEWTPVSMQSSADGLSLSLRLGPALGQCAELPPLRAYRLHFAFVARPREVLLDGAPHSAWSYDEAAGRLTIRLAARPRAAPFTLELSANRPLSLLGESRNSTLRLADARRLLGLSEAAPGLEALLELASSDDSPAHQHALARLGGPAAHVYERTTPEDARQALGVLVITAPRDGSPVSVDGRWRMFGPEGHTEQAFELAELRADAIISAPFAWDGRVATRRWALELRLNWRGRELRRQFQAQSLFPSLGNWRLLASPADKASPLGDVMDGAGAPRPTLPWVEAIHAASHGEFQNLTEYFSLPLRGYAEAHPQTPMLAYAASELHSSTVQPIRIAYQSPTPVRILLNGVELAHEQFVACSAPRLNPGWSRSALAELRPGANQLLLISTFSGAQSGWFWFLRAMALGADDLPLPMV
jgi:hypothetical protein